MSDGLIDALRSAVDAAPRNAGVRLQLGEALLKAGEAEEALLHARSVLNGQPDDVDALGLAARAAEADGQAELASSYERLLGVAGPQPDQGIVGAGPPPGQTEAEGLLIEEKPGVTLADVGGMANVKRELERSFLGPMSNPALREHYGADLGGGLLLYGPPGCGKTLLARAIAGELGAQFLSIGLDDVLDMWLGQSEQRLHSAFAEARRRAPCVLFFDEVDALGQKRGQLKGQAGRNVVNQLLSEMDGLDTGRGDDVFVLAATNHPWDVDTALRRPGRFDRTLLVLPPDAEAREAIVDLHLRDRPVESIDTPELARRTERFSGADLALVCRTAVANVMADASDRGRPRDIRQADLVAAIGETQPSTGAWFQLAYNFAAFANEGGLYDDLLAYIRKNKLS